MWKSKTTCRLLGVGAVAFSILPLPVDASTSKSFQGSSASRDLGLEEVIKGEIIKAEGDGYVVRSSDGEKVG